MTLPLVDVHVFVNGQRQTIKMERGCTFTNNGGTYGLSEEGTLMFKAKGSNDWVNTDQIKMTNYQWRIFQNMSNNDNDVNSYTRADIEKAQALYRQGNFGSDMSMDLPSGYSLDKPKLSTAEQYVQVDVMYTNSKQATLRFQIEEITALKAASQAQQQNNVQSTQQDTTPKTLSNFYEPSYEKNLTDANCNSIKEVYNADGYLIQRDIAGKKTFYIYDNGKIKEERDADGTTLCSYDYTSSGVTLRYLNGQIDVYDKNGRVVKSNSFYPEQPGNIEYSYDSKGRLCKLKKDYGEQSALEFVYSDNSTIPSQINLTCIWNGKTAYVYLKDIEWDSDGTIKSGTSIRNFEYDFGDAGSYITSFTDNDIVESCSEHGGIDDPKQAVGWWEIVKPEVEKFSPFSKKPATRFYSHTN